MKEEKNMSFMDELTGYRVKVERNGKEIMNVPGIFALPGALIAPKASILGTVAASLLGCNIHLENTSGKTVDVGQAVKDAADTVADTARTVVKTVRDEVTRTWDELSADDPEECPVGEENKEEPADQPTTEEDVPTVHVVNPDDDEKES